MNNETKKFNRNVSAITSLFDDWDQKSGTKNHQNPSPQNNGNESKPSLTSAESKSSEKSSGAQPVNRTMPPNSKSSGTKTETSKSKALTFRTRLEEATGRFGSDGETSETQNISSTNSKKVKKDQPSLVHHDSNIGNSGSLTTKDVKKMVLPEDYSEVKSALGLKDIRKSKKTKYSSSREKKVKPSKSDTGTQSNKNQSSQTQKESSKSKQTNLFPTSGTDYWASQLSEEQKRWCSPEWVAYCGSFQHVPFHELPDKVVAALNYGRNYLRLEREAKRMIERSQKIEDLFREALEDDDSTIKITKPDVSDVLAEEEITAVATGDVSSNDDIDWNSVFNEQPSKEIVVEGSPLTIREQIEQKKIAAIESIERPDYGKLQATWDTETPLNIRWTVAEKLARWETHGTKVPDEDIVQWDYEMQAMFHHCRYWVGTGQDVPVYKDLNLIYWPPDRIFDQHEKTVERRNTMTMRILSFLHRARKDRPGQWESGNPNSYRITLAAKELSRALENYATNWRSAPGPKDSWSNHRPDEGYVDVCKEKAESYFKAHAALPNLKPGPLETFDPDFVTYNRLCAIWKIKVGTLLHEAPEITGVKS